MKPYASARNNEMSLNIPQESNLPNRRGARSREVLVRELHRVANRPSTEFWAFWFGMTGEERRTVLNAAEETQPVGRQ
jgi:hypothetical protein